MKQNLKELNPKSLVEALWRETQEIANILYQDMDRVINVSNEKMAILKNSPESVFLNEQETWHRLANRLVLTTIESICYKIKQMAYQICRQRELILSDEELEFITERRKKDGRFYFIQPKENIKFSFELLARALNTKSPIEFNKKWATFLRTVKKRNELTHPKTPSDLKITPKQHDDSAETIVWFSEILKKSLGR